VLLATEFSIANFVFLMLLFVCLLLFVMCRPEHCNRIAQAQWLKITFGFLNKRSYLNA